MNLETLITEKVTETLDAKLTELVGDKVHKCIDSILTDLFRSYGDLSKQLEEQLKTALQIDLSKVKIETYNERVMQSIKAALDKILEERAQTLIKERVQSDIAYSMRDQIKLSEIVEAFAESFDWNSDGYKYPTIIVERSTWGTVYMHFDEKANKEPYNCTYNIALDKDDRKVWSYDIKGYFGSKINSALHGEFDKLIFSLYANGTVVIIDDYQTEFCRHED